MGTSSASVAELAFTLMKSINENAISQVFCTECDYPDTEYSDQLQYVFNIEKSKVSSTQKWLDISKKGGHLYSIVDIIYKSQLQ